MRQNTELSELLNDARDHIMTNNRGVFDADQADRHYRNYIEPELSRMQLELVRVLASLEPGKAILDLGCGFGTFVLACAQARLKATGLDSAEFQISFARTRAEIEIPACPNPPSYILGDARKPDLGSETFDVVTAWNLLEHVEDYRRVLAEAFRLLKPGGFLVGIAPNYAAFRSEAHYGVFWPPAMTRAISISYLQLRGRNAEYYRTSIFPVSNWGVLSAMRKIGFSVIDPDATKVHNPELIQSLPLRRAVQVVRASRFFPLFKIILRIRQWNPLKPVISFCGRKP